MLYLVGLGLGDAKDITVKGLEIVRNADFVFLEAYTSILCVGHQVLVRKWKNVYVYTVFAMYQVAGLQKDSGSPPRQTLGESDDRMK